MLFYRLKNNVDRWYNRCGQSVASRWADRHLRKNYASVRVVRLSWYGREFRRHINYHYNNKWVTCRYYRLYIYMKLKKNMNIGMVWFFEYRSSLFFTISYMYILLKKWDVAHFIILIYRMSAKMGTLYNSVTYITQYPIHILEFCRREIDDPAIV